MYTSSKVYEIYNYSLLLSFPPFPPTLSYFQVKIHWAMLLTVVRSYSVIPTAPYCSAVLQWMVYHLPMLLVMRTITSIIVTFFSHSHMTRYMCVCAHYCDCIIKGGLLTHAMEAHYCDCIIKGGLLTHAMEAHYFDCIIEGGLLTHAMEAHYCDCIIEGGLLTHAMEAHYFTMTVLHKL